MFESIFQLRRRRAIELMHLLGSYRGRRGFVLDRCALLERLGSFEIITQYRWKQQARSFRVIEQTGRVEINAVEVPNGGSSRVESEVADESQLIERLLVVLRAVIDDDGHIRHIISGDERQNRKSQYDRFEQAVRAFHQQSFGEAQAFFAEACAGPDSKIRTSSEECLRICSLRLARDDGFDEGHRRNHGDYYVVVGGCTEKTGGFDFGVSGQDDKPAFRRWTVMHRPVATRLSVMDLQETIRQLKIDKECVEQAIAILEGLLDQRPGVPAVVPKERRGRKSMPPQERRQVSERMTRYWANRRRGQAE